MPNVKANKITMNYEQQGTGEPLVLIPYLAADNACYAFQVADYAKRFTCISVDPRGAGATDKPAGAYSTELFADDMAAFIHALGIDRAHVAGLSFGAATGMWLAAKYPQHQIFIYAADHGFNCDQRGSYNAPAAKQARERTLAFFRKHVG